MSSLKIIAKRVIAELVIKTTFLKPEIDIQGYLNALLQKLSSFRSNKGIKFTRLSPG